MKKQLAYFSFFFLFCGITAAQEAGAWVLKNKKEGITIYTRNIPNSNLKELKMNTIAKTTLSGIVAVMAEMETSPDWMDGSFTVTKLDVKRGKNQYNRTTIDFPFPIKDRDLVGFSTGEQHADTKVVTVTSTGDPAAYPEQDGYVRMPLLKAKWILTPIENGEVRMDYFLRSDPGGSIPTWVTNLLLDYGPFRTFKAILEQLPKEQFQRAEVDWVEG